MNLKSYDDAQAVIKNSVLIDIEASNMDSGDCLELGWSVGGKIPTSYLLKWDDSFLDNWSDISAGVHKITKEEMIDSGHRPEKIIELFEAASAGLKIYSDAPLFDEEWLRNLYSQANMLDQFRCRVNAIEPLCAAYLAKGMGQDYYDNVFLHKPVGEIFELLTRVAHAMSGMKESKHRAKDDIQAILSNLLEIEIIGSEEAANNR